MRFQTRGEGQRRSAGLTLLELVVVAAILGLLAAILVPGLGRGGSLARQVRCLDHLRQVGLALRAYTATNFYCLPDCTRRPSLPPLGEENLPGLASILMPWLDERRVLQCPGDDGRFMRLEGTSYEWNSLLNGKAVGQERLIVVGVSLEVPLVSDYEPFHLPAGKPGKNFLYADGCVLSQLR
ncbi:MAG: type II secretion system protein [Planctomycetes bacterium]|nr:type II secretion system protein [Planctomycetota bacterium]